MKKYLGALALVVLFIPAISSAVVSDVDPQGDACANITQNLRYGMGDRGANANIFMLQDFLNTNNYLSVSSTGFFGKATLKAVMAFQEANDISPTGYVGAFTRAKIQAMDCGAGERDPVAQTPATEAAITAACAPSAWPSLAVTSPGRKEQYLAGQEITATWTSCNVSAGTKLHLEVWSGAGTKYLGSYTIADPNNTTPSFFSTHSDVLNTGSYTFHLPSPTASVPWLKMQSGSQYRIAMGVDQSNGQGWRSYLSPGDFTIIVPDSAMPVEANTGVSNGECTSSTPPSIAVTAPGDGETYSAGKSVTITWTSCNIPKTDHVLINLLGKSLNSGTGAGYELTTTDESRLNDGSETVTFPTKASWPLMQYGNFYSVVVMLRDDSINPAGVSDGAFSVTEPPGTAAI